MDNQNDNKEFKGKDTVWTSSPSTELPLKTHLGTGKEASESAITVFQAFQENVKKNANRIAMSTKAEGQKDWTNITWQEYYDKSIQFAKALLSLGFQPYDAVSIIGFNSPEWMIADLGAIAAGGIAAGIYTTNQPDSCHYIVSHSSSVVVVAENEQQMAKFMQIRDRLPKVKAYVQWSGKVPQEKDVYSWDDFLALGKSVDTEEVNKRIAAQKPECCCTLIYTSGTTGNPKGVMISHDNCTWTARRTGEIVASSPEDHVISYLPLSHIAAQMIDIHGPIHFGYRIYFARPDALRGSLAQTLKEVRPTIFLGVPRVWEKFHEKMLEVGKSKGSLAQGIGSWAKGVGLEGTYNKQKGLDVPWGWWLADTLVFSNIRNALGLDRCKIMATAAAPISKETLDYFNSINLPLMEIYGMSECTGPQTCSVPNKYQTGYAGWAMPGTEMKIDNPDDEGNGEICFRGRHIMMGYLNNDQATAETIDGDGWLHSGDIGVVDKHGYLKITGRLKELIITAGGENVPPVLIENEIKKEIGDIVSNVIVIGDRKKFLSCLVTLKAQPLPEDEKKENEYPLTSDLEKSALNKIQQLGSEAKTIQDAQNDEKIRKYIEAGITTANKRATSQAQRVQKFEIVPRDFTVEGGELTPTLKLKRRIVVQKYDEVIEKIYE